MKKICLSISVLLFVVFITSLTSCKKNVDFKCNTCVTAPEAKAAYDNNSGGIYKGVVVGSTGSIKFNVMNDGSTITAVMIIDGTTVNLTSNVTWNSGQPYLAPFTGTLNGQPVSITFSVDLSGSNPTISSVNIPGHPDAVLSVFKETSNNQVVCFEGNFSGTSSGTLNVILSTGLGVWAAVAKDGTQSSVTHINGTISGNTISCSSCIGGAGSVSGTLSGDQIVNGTWNDGSNGSGTWSANKTL